VSRTINANGVLSGVAAVSNTTSFAANNGSFAGFFVTKWSGTVDWDYGFLIDPGAVATAGIYMPGGTAMKAMRIGTLSSTTAGSGATLDATITRIVEVHADDNDTARAVGTQGRAIFGRTMIYADNACEDWGIDGLSKMSAVAKTGNVSAGVVGRFESTGTCSTATGSGNTFVAGVMGRLGGGGTFTLGAGTYACGVLSFYNTSTTNDFTGDRTCAFMATASDIAGTGDWDYGLFIEDTVDGIYSSTTTQAFEMIVSALPANARGARLAFTCATPAMSDGYGAFETDLTVSGTATGQVSAASCWVNIGGSAVLPASNYTQVHTDGIWDGGGTLGGNIAYVRYQCLLASNPAWCSLFDLNFSGANSELDAIFNCNDASLALGFTAGSPSGSATGTIPFFSTAGGSVKYIYVYDA
jgi:hypothetical protein